MCSLVYKCEVQLLRQRESGVGANMSKFAEQSIVSRKNVIVIGIAIAFFLFMLSSSIFRWMHGIRVTPLEVGSLVIILFVLLERAQPRYEYEADTRRLLLKKIGMFGNKNVEVEYRQIIGIYAYKAKLVSILKFRRTHRMNSALDGRDVWVIAYKVLPSGKTEHNERVYFKPSEQLLEFLSSKLPGKVKVPENQVVVEALSKDIKDQ
jgi:hypothetical protein